MEFPPYDFLITTTTTHFEHGQQFVEMYSFKRIGLFVIFALTRTDAAGRLLL